MNDSTSHRSSSANTRPRTWGRRRFRRSHYSDTSFCPTLHSTRSPRTPGVEAGAPVGEGVDSLRSSRVGNTWSGRSIARFGYRASVREYGRSGSGDRAGGTSVPRIPLSRTVPLDSRGVSLWTSV